jgi:hypothetical protein
VKVQGTDESKILNAVSIAKQSRLVKSEEIISATLTDGNFYNVMPGTFRIFRARAGNEAQSGPPFVRFDTELSDPDVNGNYPKVTVETFLSSLVAVMYPIVSPEEQDDNETAESLTPPGGDHE